MTIVQSIVLGLIQGITEFLPISSSGHLILVRELLGMPIVGSLAFDVWLNTATLLAVVICFWGTLRGIVHDFVTEGFSARSRTLLLALIIGSIPAGFVGFMYGDLIEQTFRSAHSVAWALLIGSFIMFIADKVGNTRGGLTLIKGFVIGCFQTLALVSGFSRSGMTISGGLFVGLSREEAIRFSFLLLIPVSVGALLKMILDLGSSDFQSSMFNLESIIAFVVALVSGIWAVRFLVRYLSKNSFTPFVIYRILLALAIFLFV